MTLISGQSEAKVYGGIRTSVPDFVGIIMGLVLIGGFIYFLFVIIVESFKPPLQPPSKKETQDRKIKESQQISRLIALHREHDKGNNRESQ